MHTRAKLLIAAAGLAAGGVAVSAVALTGDDPGQQVPVATPSRAFPFSETVDAASARLIAERDGRKIYVARGQGKVAGMICFVVATGSVAHTGCDPEDVVQTRGIVLSQDEVGDQIALVAYLPDGFTTAELPGGAISIDRNVLSALVPRNQREIVVTGPAGRLVLKVPGAQ